MTTIWFVFILALAIGLVATMLAATLARRLGVVDRPDGLRHVHACPTPRLGGLAVYAGFVLPLMRVYYGGRWTALSETLQGHATHFHGLVAGATLALALGIVDDVFELRPLWKLIWQVFIGGVACSAWFAIRTISSPLGGSIDLGVMAFPVTVLWFVLCMNAINLLDGLDGLASGACLFVAGTLFLVSLSAENWLGMLFMAALGGANLGFLVFNFPPARVFLGDSGSMLLGYLVAATSLVGATMKAETAVALLIPVVALGLPFFDTSLAITRRWYHGLPLALPDRRHVHHVLLKLGYSPRRVVLALYACCLLLGAAALLITFGRNEVVALVIGALVITGLVSVRFFAGLTPADIWRRLVRRRRMQEGFAHMYNVAEQGLAGMETATDAAALWAVCRDTFARLDLPCRSVVLDLDAQTGAPASTWAWNNPTGSGSGDRRDSWAMELIVSCGPRTFGSLRFIGCSMDAASAGDCHKLVIHLRDGLARRLDRLRPAVLSTRPEAGDAFHF